MHGNDHIYGGPDPIPGLGISSVPWITGFGTGTAPSTNAFITCDTDTFILTNAADVFEIQSASTPDGTLNGIKCLQDGFYFITVGSQIQIAAGSMPGPAKNYQAILGVGQADGMGGLNDIGNDVGFIQQSVTMGTNLISGFHSAVNDAIWDPWLCAEFAINSGAGLDGPIFMIAAQNTGVNANADVFFRVDQLWPSLTL